LSEPRIPPRPRADWEPEALDALAVLRPPGSLRRPAEPRRDRPASNILGIFSWHPALAKAFFTFNNHLFRSTLSARDREMATVRVAWLRRGEYEWAQHVRMAVAAGLSGEEVDAISAGPDSPRWGPRDAALLRSVDEIVADRYVSDETWKQLSEHLDRRQLMDLVFTIGAHDDPMSLFPERPEGDDITEFVNANRRYLPQNDQIVSSDPPSHTAQRALLMGLITPKRLKENEEFIWRLTDRQLDVILARGTAEIMADYATPYTLLVIADLLGVPEEDHEMLLGRRAGTPMMLGERGSAAQEADDGSGQRRGEGRRATGRNTFEVFYDYFSARITERRRQPLGDVLTGMAQALFPDGTVPEPIEVARIARRRRQGRRRWRGSAASGRCPRARPAQARA
jgi:4-carboxymuconolactone decarboxylase